MEIELENDQQQAVLTDKEIFTKIWTSPRVVFKFLNGNRYDNAVIVLLVLAGISNAFDRGAMNSNANHSVWSILAISIIMGGIFGWISFYIYSALVSWAGNWLEGKASTKEVLRVMAHAMIPSIAGFLFLLPMIILFGNDSLPGLIAIDGLLENIIFYFLFGVKIIMAIWTIILAVIGVSEVQKFSIWTTILNLALPVVIIVVPAAAIIFLAASF